MKNNILVPFMPFSANTLVSANIFVDTTGLKALAARRHFPQNAPPGRYLRCATPACNDPDDCVAAALVIAAGDGCIPSGRRPRLGEGERFTLVGFVSLTSSVKKPRHASANTMGSRAMPSFGVDGHWASA
jgi:hypothetical protein